MICDQFPMCSWQIVGIQLMKFIELLLLNDACCHFFREVWRVSKHQHENTFRFYETLLLHCQTYRMGKSRNFRYYFFEKSKFTWSNSAITLRRCTNTSHSNQRSKKALKTHWTHWLLIVDCCITEAALNSLKRHPGHSTVAKVNHRKFVSSLCRLLYRWSLFALRVCDSLVLAQFCFFVIFF